jgi:hypothetical protein
MDMAMDTAMVAMANTANNKFFILQQARRAETANIPLVAALGGALVGTQHSVSTIRNATSAISASLILLACLIGTSTAAWAGDWQFTSALSLSERYSDNINLNADGQEKSDWITEVTPRFSLARTGGRLKVNADYSLQGTLYANASNQNDIRHGLNGRAHAELAKDWLFLDSTARISQQPTNLNAAFGLGDAVGIDNTTTVSAYTLSPYIKRRLGSAATLVAKVTREEVFSQGSAISDTGSTRYQLGATSGPRFLPLSWAGHYEKSDTDNTGLTSTGFERASANARFQLNRKFGLLAQANMEKNDFIGASSLVQDYTSYGLGAFFTPGRRISMDVYFNDSDNGHFISGNLSLNPTLRTTINASTSERAYGRTHALKLTHRTRKSNWSLNYQDDLTTSQQQFANFTGFLCPTGVLPPDPSCIVIFNQPQSNETFVAKNLIGGVSYTQRRNTWNLSLYNNQREFLSNNAANTSANTTTNTPTNTTRGVQASWSLRPAARTTFTLSGGLSTIDTHGTLGRKDALSHIGLVISRQFKATVSGSVEVRHQEREAHFVSNNSVSNNAVSNNSASNDYAENSVAARLNMSF